MNINPELCKPKGLEMKDIIESDIIFISVPTPMNKDGSCHIGILESVTELSLGVTVPPLSEPSSMAKKLVLAAGAVVKVSVLDDTVKSVPGFWITPPTSSTEISLNSTLTFQQLSLNSNSTLTRTLRTSPTLMSLLSY